jgi:hypothetical protein
VATVKSFKADAAQGMPGVKQVLQTSSGVAVIADSWWQAKQARDALQIEWTPGPNAKLTNAAISAGLKTGCERQGQAGPQGRRRGSGSEIRRRFEATYELPAARARDDGADELHRRVPRRRLPHLRADAGSADRTRRGSAGLGTAARESVRAHDVPRAAASAAVWRETSFRPLSNARKR